MNGPSLLLHQMPLNIEPDISDQNLLILLLPRVRLRRTAALIRANEFAELKRLCNVIVCACVQRFHLAVFACLAL